MDPFSRRCQKPDHDRIGTWMARQISRPVALRVTRIAAPLGVSATAATLAAWAVGLAAAVALGHGTVGGWLLAAGLLQLWYLLDHVDGQLARLHGTASLDGAQLDYLMHHTIHLAVPFGAGYGLGIRRAEPLWIVAGLVWGVGLLLITLQHDARYKAFFIRLKRLHGRLDTHGGGGGRPEPQPPMPRRPLRLAAWAARKACEMHVIMNLLALLAVIEWLAADARLALAAACVAIMAPGAVVVAMVSLVRSQRRGAAELEFRQWHRVPPGHTMIFADGWWIVEPESKSRPMEK